MARYEKEYLFSYHQSRRIYFKKPVKLYTLSETKAYNEEISEELLLSISVGEKGDPRVKAEHDAFLVLLSLFSHFEYWNKVCAEKELKKAQKITANLFIHNNRRFMHTTAHILRELRALQRNRIYGSKRDYFGKQVVSALAKANTVMKEQFDLLVNMDCIDD